jgi:hypothetical protein
VHRADLRHDEISARKGIPIVTAVRAILDADAAGGELDAPRRVLERVGDEVRDRLREPQAITADERPSRAARRATRRPRPAQTTDGRILKAAARRRRVHPRSPRNRVPPAHRRRQDRHRARPARRRARHRARLHPLRQRPRADRQRPQGLGRFSRAGSAYIQPGSPWQNPYVESFGSGVRDELLTVELFSCLAEARVLIEDWRQDYNHHRATLGAIPRSCGWA